MSTQQTISCIHKGVIPISVRHEEKITHKLACSDCIELIQSLSTFQILSEKELPGASY